jgi:uncharacterized protein with PQ loop repeat
MISVLYLSRETQCLSTTWIRESIQVNDVLLKINYVSSFKYAFDMEESEIKVIPYTATSISIVARFIFMFLLYKNKSTNSFSLTFCLLNICSASMWTYYSFQTEDMPLVIRSSTEIFLLFISAIYIIRNKMIKDDIVDDPP